VASATLASAVFSRLAFSAAAFSSRPKCSTNDASLNRKAAPARLDSCASLHFPEPRSTLFGLRRVDPNAKTGILNFFKKSSCCAWAGHFGRRSLKSPMIIF
jgi:hypothetical protein